MQRPSLSDDSIGQDQIDEMRAFVKTKWAERAIELGRETPADLTGACIFATAFAHKVLGGEVRGNWHHTYLDVDGQTVDLTEGEGVREQAIERQQLHSTYPSMRSPHFVGPDVDIHMHDPSFLATPDFRDTWDSVQERAAMWASEYLALDSPGVDRQGGIDQ